MVSTGTFALFHQRRPDKGLPDAGVVLGKVYREAQVKFNLLRFFKDNVEDKPVYRVVLSVNHGTAHLGRFLPEAVYPALALFMAGGIPGQIVMNNRVKTVLKVDAFGKTVGGNEYGQSGFEKFIDFFFPFFRG